MFEEYLGISTDYVVIGMAAVILLLIILMIINVVQMSKLKKRYAIFMSGKNAKSLEDTLVYRLEQVDELIENKYVFAIQAKLFEAEFHAGEFVLNTEDGPDDIIEILSRKEKEE